MKKKFEDMKIGGKLVAAFAIIIFLYIVTIITVIANINSMNERTQLLYDEPFANVESSLWMIANLQSVGKNVTLLISTEDVVDEEEYLEKTSQNVAEIEKQKPLRDACLSRDIVGGGVLVIVAGEHLQRGVRNARLLFRRQCEKFFVQGSPSRSAAGLTGRSSFIIRH